VSSNSSKVVQKARLVSPLRASVIGWYMTDEKVKV
jgi:hypothetical protein